MPDQHIVVDQHHQASLRGVSALAAPVPDHRGQIVLAINAIGPSAALNTC